jgi:hypothetical protein
VEGKRFLLRLVIPGLPYPIGNINAGSGLKFPVQVSKIIEGKRAIPV